jgi:hypothetical protein
LSTSAKVNTPPRTSPKIRVMRRSSMVPSRARAVACSFVVREGGLVQGTSPEFRSRHATAGLRRNLAPGLRLWSRTQPALRTLHPRHIFRQDKMLKSATFAPFARLAVPALFAAAVLASSAIPSVAQRGGTQPFCLSAGSLCVSATPAQYNRCYSLSLQRGFSSRRDDDYARNNFIYQCLTGRVPR